MCWPTPIQAEDTPFIETKAG